MTRKSILRQITDHKDGSKIGLTVAAVVLALLALTWLGMKNAEAWQRYVDEHHCTVVSTKAGHYQTSHGWSNGKSITFDTWIDGETCYACDPGPLGTSVCQ